MPPIDLAARIDRNQTRARVRHKRGGENRVHVALEELAVHIRQQRRLAGRLNGCRKQKDRKGVVETLALVQGFVYDTRPDLCFCYLDVSE
jgi:hypothetical protein